MSDYAAITDYTDPRNYMKQNKKWYHAFFSPVQSEHVLSSSIHGRALTALNKLSEAGVSPDCIKMVNEAFVSKGETNYTCIAIYYYHTEHLTLH